MSDSTDSQYVQGFISGQIKHSDDIAKLQDKLYSRIGVNGYRKQDIHLTIYPFFTIKKSDIHNLQKFVDYLGIEGEPIYVRGAGVWPNLENPRVILLDCESDIHGYRSEIESKLDELEAKISREPVSPHITLFKSDGKSRITEPTKKKIQTEILKKRFKWNTEIEHIDIVVKEVS